MPSRSPTSSPSPRSSALNVAFSQRPASPKANEKPENADPNIKAFNPRLAFAGAAGQDGRRPSVQFASAKTVAEGTRPASPVPSGSPKTLSARTQRRLSSPPPPSAYERRVSFNTFDNRDATDYSFTIGTKHKNYHYSQRSRTFFCGTDDNDYSETAVEWLIEELVEDGDEIICLRVVDKDSRFASDSSIRDGTYKKEAEQLLERTKNKNKEGQKAISLTLEFAVGKVPEVFQKMIRVYAPACLVVGTKGKSLGGMQSFVTGSVSRYCLQNSPVPVVVVRPSEKRMKKKMKRLADDKRRGYKNVLALSGAKGSQILNNKSEMDKLVGHASGEASEKEARAVAAAIGLPKTLSGLPGLRKAPGPEDEGAPLSRTVSGKSDVTTSAGESPSPTGALAQSPPLPGDEPSPEFEPLDSPSLSDEEEEKEAKAESEGEEARGRTMSQDEGARRTGAKRFVFPNQKRSHSGG